jgi:predicted esterase
MGAPEWKELDGSWSSWGSIAFEDFDSDFFVVVPAGWNDSMWWEHSQHRNFHAILAEMKRTWNIDEDRITMFGSSDGAIAEWFWAFRDPDPWTGYIGWVGFPARLTNRTMRPDGQMHLSNLTGQRFLLHNGVRDRIVDIDVTRKYLDVVRREDVEIEAYEHPEDGHDLNLTDEEVERFMRFFREARRDPLPDRLSWATERVDRYARRAWLEILALDPDAEADADNVLPRITGRNVPRLRPLEVQPWGRVELEREGNTVRATTRGVRRFRLLLSPDEFDLARPVRVELNGDLAFEGVVAPDLGLLLRMAARDADRRRMFVAELVLDVPE